ncbi:MAG: Type secretion system hydrolase TadA/VirB11/CpaF, TadA subfamily, partial [Frankiales bacterium]|nr:Type secretion system hydrolase TadA/VirB11/CpaF, TadA subfamily [Frankiales bacterium]
MKLADRLNQLEVEKAQEATKKAGPRVPKPAAPTSRRSSRGAAKPTATAWDGLKRQVKDLVVEDLGSRLAGIEDLSEEVTKALDKAIAKSGARITTDERARLVTEVSSDILGYGPLDPLLRDTTVDEIMCNAYNDIYVERAGRLEHTDATFADEAHFRQVIERIVSGVGRRVDEGSPLVDARLPDGSRVTASLPPLSVRGPVMTIRKFAERPFTIADLVANRTLSMDAGVFLEA